MDTSSAFMAVFDVISKLIFFIMKILAVILIPFFLMMGFFMLKKAIKGIKKPKGLGRKIYRGNPLKKLYYDFPKLLVDDIYEKNPDDLDKTGVYLFCGEQGSGKSVAVVEFLLQLKKRYPFLKIRSNISLDFQDDRFTDWKSLVFNTNGTAGQVEFIDEIQNWFNSMESKNFPPEMLQEITQQRKQRKLIIGTSQVFQRVAKPLREQCTLLFLPFTVAGCMTFVRVYKPKLDQDGTVQKMRMMNFYFFVHTKEIREAYNTYEKVERLTKKGFLPRSEQIGNKELSTIAVPDK